ncbi:glycosyltransferase family 2 protein [Erythrobacter dokdonensis]|uniref:Glycosyl transferase n=1 Tax=Erythrobacter dokdonensis DSW-74 TaxID=1300349 RepID=A0A1A7BFB9_9SPHN|nr:glycosyltransferase family 2 protein [Erythrobacter dokdonensis]OBV11218.1 Glycosyl transferase [Erythrobacter dokdonensis DSW-74]
MAPSPPLPTVSILIVAYNSTSVITSCLASIPQACGRHDFEVLLVDNGDGSTETLVTATFPDVQIVPSRGNIGFAGGNNLLAAQARGRFLLLLNPDMVLEAEAIDYLIDAAVVADPSVAAWGGVTLDRAGNPDYGNTVHIPSLREMASRMLGRSIAVDKGHLGIDADAEVAVLSGSFILFQRQAWDEVEGLDARYFLYCEEVDLFYRLSLRGYKFWRIAKSRAFHDIGHGQAITPVRMLYRAAGNMEFARRHWNGRRQELAFILMWLGAWQRVIAGWLLGRWFPHIQTVGSSHRDIALRPGFWRHGYDPDRGLLAKLGNR